MFIYMDSVTHPMKRKSLQVSPEIHAYIYSKRRYPRETVSEILIRELKIRDLQ